MFICLSIAFECFCMTVPIWDSADLGKREKREDEIAMALKTFFLFFLEVACVTFTHILLAKQVRRPNLGKEVYYSYRDYWEAKAWLGHFRENSDSNAV